MLTPALVCAVLMSPRVRETFSGAQAPRLWKSNEKSCRLAVTEQGSPQQPEMLVRRVCSWAAMVLALEPGSQAPSSPVPLCPHLPPELHVDLQASGWDRAHGMSQSITAAETEGNLTRFKPEGADPDAGAPQPRPGPLFLHRASVFGCSTCVLMGLCPSVNPCSFG